MSNGTPAETIATGAQINPLLRQKMLSRAATFSEGAQAPRPTSMNGRRSSILSDFSDTRQSFPRPGGKDADVVALDEPSLWYSAPLAFAILPAVGGLLFTNGQGFMTDILLLGFAAIFLNHCVRAPWDWYHAAQQVQYTDIGQDPRRDSIMEEDEEDEDTEEEEEGIAIKSGAIETAPKAIDEEPSTETKIQQDASRELTTTARLALVACFLGPILGAGVLHAIRSQLTRPAEGLISNYNLTIFTMAAELRPITHVVKLMQGRIVHLQRVVQAAPKSGIGGPEAEQLSLRLAEVEAQLAEPVPGSSDETAELRAAIQQKLQPQLDALNRAVRRYEKQQVALSIQTEARFQDLETRLGDTLALAAAAARTGQQPGMISFAFTWVLHAVTYAVHTVWGVVTYPYRVTSGAYYRVRSRFVKAERHPPRKRVKKAPRAVY